MPPAAQGMCVFNFCPERRGADMCSVNGEKWKCIHAAGEDLARAAENYAMIIASDGRDSSKVKRFASAIRAIAREVRKGARDATTKVVESFVDDTGL